MEKLGTRRVSYTNLRTFEIFTTLYMRVLMRVQHPRVRAGHNAGPIDRREEGMPLYVVRAARKVSKSSPWIVRQKRAHELLGVFVELPGKHHNALVDLTKGIAALRGIKGCLSAVTSGHAGSMRKTMRAQWPLHGPQTWVRNHGGS